MQWISVCFGESFPSWLRFTLMLYTVNHCFGWWIVTEIHLYYIQWIIVCFGKSFLSWLRFTHIIFSESAFLSVNHFLQYWDSLILYTGNQYLCLWIFSMMTEIYSYYKQWISVRVSESFPTWLRFTLILYTMNLFSSGVQNTSI